MTGSITKFNVTSVEKPSIEASHQLAAYLCAKKNESLAEELVEKNCALEIVKIPFGSEYLML